MKKRKILFIEDQEFFVAEILISTLVELSEKKVDDRTAKLLLYDEFKFDNPDGTNLPYRFRFYNPRGYDIAYGYPFDLEKLDGLNDEKIKPFRNFFSKMGYEIHFARSFERALIFLSANEYYLISIDGNIKGDGHGKDVFEWIIKHKKYLLPSCIALSSDSSYLNWVKENTPSKVFDKSSNNRFDEPETMGGSIPYITELLKREAL